MILDSVVNNKTLLGDFIKGAGYLFYIVQPNETSYEDYNNVPNYHINVSID